MTSELTEDVVLQISSPHILAVITKTLKGTPPTNITVKPSSIDPTKCKLKELVHRDDFKEARRRLQAESSGAAGGGGGGGGGGRGAAELGRRLLAAARGGHTGAVLELMARGAPFTADWLGTSALHLAAAGAHLDTCAVLLRAGVSRDARTKVERTPLHLAAHAGHAPAAALLLRHGAAPDARDMLRMTPLHWAAERGHAATAALLLRHGADPRATTKFGKTPLQLAEARHHADVAAALRDALRAAPERATSAPEEDPREIPAAEQRRALESIEGEPTDAGREPDAPLDDAGPGEGPREPDAELEPAGEGDARAPEGERAAGAEGGEAGPAAALLRRHGIALLPRDDGSTVLNAIQSGRTVVLSDAGKLMLKESVSEGGGAGGKVVLTATPVRSPPRAGVKIFTLNNNNLVALAGEAPAPSRAAPQIKVAGAGGVRVAPLKAKARVARAGARPAVKIIMHKASFDKMVSGGGGGAGGAGVEAGPEAQLAAARAAVARLSREVDSLKARLARYEPV